MWYHIHAKFHSQGLTGSEFMAGYGGDDLTPTAWLELMKHYFSKNKQKPWL